MRVFINAIIVHTFLNLYVFWKGWKIIPPKYAYRIPFIAIFVLELVTYLFGFILVDEISINQLYPIMKIGTSWMVFILYMTILLVVYDLLNILSKRINLLDSKLNLKSVWTKRKYFAVSVLLVVGAMIYGNYRFWHPVVNEVNVNIYKRSDIKNLRIVMVADIHAGYMINRNILKMYVDKIMEQNPDIILIVGDVIDYDLLPLNAERMDEEFRRLKAPYGVFAVTGNHEYRLDAEAKIEWLREKAGFTVLRDSVVKVNDSFYLVGREDYKAPKRAEIEELIDQVDRNLPVIVMNHQPRELSQESEMMVDMAFYGHTHNGQMFPYNVLINMMYELGHGYKQKKNTHMYVTSGLGLSGPQYRIGTISEIVVINAQFY